jgi:hypothetical protein
MKCGDTVINNRSGELGIVDTILPSGSIAVREEPNVTCTHDSESTLTVVNQVHTPSINALRNIVLGE